MAIALVQKAGYANNTATQITQAYGSSNVLGHLLVAMVWSTSSDITSVTDTAGNTWLQAGSASTNGSIWYVASCKAGANTVQLNKSGSAARGFIAIAEYSGQATSGPVLDETNYGGAGNSTSPISQLYVGNAGCLLIEQMHMTSASVNWSAFTGGYTAESSVSNQFVVWADNTNSSLGMNTGAATTSSSDVWGVKVASFLPSSLTAPVGIAFTRTAESDVKALTAAQTNSCFFPGGNAAGNLILAFVVQFFPATNETTTPTDTAGNAYSLLTSYHDPHVGVFVSIYKVNGCLGIATANTLTTTWVTGNIGDSVDFYAVEFTGQSIGSLLDTSTTATTTGTSVNYNITAAKAGELLITSDIRNSGNTLGSLGSQVNLTYQGGPNINAGESTLAYLIPSVSGANAITCTWGGTGGGSITLALNPAVFPPTGGGTPGGGAGDSVICFYNPIVQPLNF